MMMLTQFRRHNPTNTIATTNQLGQTISKREIRQQESLWTIKTKNHQIPRMSSSSSKKTSNSDRSSTTTSTSKSFFDLTQNFICTITQAISSMFVCRLLTNYLVPKDSTIRSWLSLSTSASKSKTSPSWSFSSSRSSSRAFSYSQSSCWEFSSESSSSCYDSVFEDNYSLSSLSPSPLPQEIFSTAQNTISKKSKYETTKIKKKKSFKLSKTFGYIKDSKLSTGKGEQDYDQMDQLNQRNDSNGDNHEIYQPNQDQNSQQQLSQQRDDLLAREKRFKVTEKQLLYLKHKIEKLLVKLESEYETELATTPDEECVICISAKATMQTFPCGHRVVCRKCFVKTIQMVVSQRMLPLRCVICRAKVLRLKQTTTGGFCCGSVGYIRNMNSHNSSSTTYNNNNHNSKIVFDWNNWLRGGGLLFKTLKPTTITHTKETIKMETSHPQPLPPPTRPNTLTLFSQQQTSSSCRTDQSLRPSPSPTKISPSTPTSSLTEIFQAQKALYEYCKENQNQSGSNDSSSIRFRNNLEDEDENEESSSHQLFGDSIDVDNIPNDSVVGGGNYHHCNNDPGGGDDDNQLFHQNNVTFERKNYRQADLSVVVQLQQKLQQLLPHGNNWRWSYGPLPHLCSTNRSFNHLNHYCCCYYNYYRKRKLSNGYLQHRWRSRKCLYNNEYNYDWNRRRQLSLQSSLSKMPQSINWQQESSSTAATATYGVIFGRLLPTSSSKTTSKNDNVQSKQIENLVFDRQQQRSKLTSTFLVPIDEDEECFEDNDQDQQPKQDESLDYHHRQQQNQSTQSLTNTSSSSSSSLSTYPYQLSPCKSHSLNPSNRQLSTKKFFKLRKYCSESFLLQKNNKNNKYSDMDFPKMSLLNEEDGFISSDESFKKFEALNQKKQNQHKKSSETINKNRNYFTTKSNNRMIKFRSASISSLSSLIAGSLSKIFGSTKTIVSSSEKLNISTS